MTRNRKTVLCTIVHHAVKQRRNTGIADIIGIADIVLLSILSIDPALDSNAHTTWNDNTKNVFQKEHSVLRNANTKYDALFIHIRVRVTSYARKQTINEIPAVSSKMSFDGRSLSRPHESPHILYIFRK